MSWNKLPIVLIIEHEDMHTWWDKMQVQSGVRSETFQLISGRQSLNEGAAVWAVSDTHSVQGCLARCCTKFIKRFLGKILHFHICWHTLGTEHGLNRQMLQACTGSDDQVA